MMAPLFKKKQIDAEPFKVQNPDEVHPPLAEAKALVATLSARNHDLDRRINPGRNRTYRDGKTAAQLIDEALAGKSFEPGRIRSHDEIVAGYRAEQAVVQGALAKAKLTLDALKREADRKVCDVAREEFLRRANHLVATMRAAHAAHREFEALKDDLRDLDVSFTAYLPSFTVTNLLGHPRESDSKVEYFLREAAAAGVTGETA